MIPQALQPSMVDAQRGPNDRDVNIAFLLADVLRLTREEFRRNASGLRLTPALARLLFYVDQRPGCSQTELARYLDLTTVTVGRMLDRLQAGGFVRRLPDVADRRTFRIHLDTPAGPLVARMPGILRRTTDRAMRDLDTSERDTLRATLARMRASLTSEEA